MRPAPQPGFLLVARRECRWLFHDRVALLLIFGVPLFAFVVLTTVFSHPVIRGLGVTIVDEDRSDASRALVEYVAASPSLHIVDRSGTLSTAAQDIRSGKAISAVYIPPNFERDLKAGRRPQVVGFYNQQFLTAAGIASSGLSDTLSAAAAAAAPAHHAAREAASVGTLTGETIALVNPQKNYAQFLLRALLPMIIHVVITLAAGYSVGSEFRRRDMRAWLESAGGDPVVALVGKLAPLFGIFFLITLAEALFLEGVLKIPFRGELLLMVSAASLVIIAHLSLGALLQLLAGDLASGLGLVGLFVSPAFGYAGVGFPTVGMNAFAQGWSAILPLRWYMAILLGQAARGLPVSESAVPFAALAGLTVLFAGLALLRMQAQLTRASTLARRSFESQQTLDQAENDAASARADVAEAQANYDAAVVGPTQEERAIAEAQVQAAAASLAVLERRLEKMILRAPTDGVISVIAAEVGENVRAGQPILMVEATGEQWFSFNVREDYLGGLAVGKTVNVMRSDAGEAIKSAVTGLRPLGTFAIWQAERVIGDHDRNTLRVRLDPLGGSAGLEPGMTVWIER
jgi:ABC-2 type transport system permease protein